MEVSAGYKRTKVGVIPAEWETVRLADVSAFITKGSTPTTYGFEWQRSGVLFLRSECVSPEGLDLAQSMFISAEAHRALRRSAVQPHDLLITITGNVGRVVTVPGDLGEANINQHIARIRILGEEMDPGWVFHFLSQPGVRQHFEKITTGQAYPQISLVQVRDALIPRPAIAEQRTIAAALSDVDALLGGLDRLIAKKRDLKQAAMQQLLTGRARLPGFSGEWDTVEFGDITAIRNSKVVASSTPAGTPCVELESIDQGTGRLLTSAEARGMASKYSFRKGDVLFGRLRAYLRKYWLAAFDGVCSTEIWPLIARDERLAGGFLHVLVQTNDFVNAAGVSYGTHMPRSDWSVLQKFPVALPPVPEQTEIAAVLSDMDAELAGLEARRDKTGDLKQAMMQELLTGKTRLVPAGAIHA